MSGARHFVEVIGSKEGATRVLGSTIKPTYPIEGALVDPTINLEEIETTGFGPSPDELRFLREEAEKKKKKK